MDINDFIKEYNEKYGLADEEWERQKNNVILLFAEEEGRIMARYKNVPVFRNRDSESKISAGETWICSLDNKQTYYFARGLQRIDSSFMYELKRDQIDEIAAAVWADQRHIIEPLLEEKYKEIMNEHIAAAVEKERKEYTQQIEGLKEQVRSSEQKDAENKQIISSLQEKISKAQDAGHRKRPVSAGEADQDMLGQITETHVNRDGPDTISSPMFDRSRYFAHLSADHRILVIKPHGSGNIVCINSTIVLSGLSLISPFEGQCEMVSEYNPKYGGIQIYL